MLDRSLLTINGGSSSIKFAVFTCDDPPQRLLAGVIERIGEPDATLHATLQSGKTIEQLLPADNHTAAAQHLIEWLAGQTHHAPIAAIGHRIVHGGLHLITHQPITPDLLAQLKLAQPLDLAHLPREIALIEAFQHAFPAIPQIACFDTAFHHDLPHVAQLLPIPRKYLDAGLRKLGFHGLSYTYLMAELHRIAGPAAANGRVILAHLGSGASMAAVHHGKPIDTTMAFTPTAGLVMATRPGDLDPGLLVYLLRTEKFTPNQLDDFISRQCGLVGVSGTTSDMRDLAVRRDHGDPHAADAIDLFCFQARKFIAALATTMNGLDTLIFSGGIGEHAPDIRAQICSNLSFLNLHLDPQKNAANAPIISTDQSQITLRVIPTNEELIIAQTLTPFLPKGKPKK